MSWPGKVRNAGSLEEAQVILWRAVLAGQAGLYKAMAADDHEGVRKYVHALTQVIGAYGNLTETVNLGAEIEELKRQLPLRRAV